MRETEGMKLDRSRPFGKIAPPMVVEEADAVAHYEQDGALFDAFDAKIIAKSETPRHAATVTATTDDSGEGEPISVEALLAQAETMPYQRLVKNAKVILGDKCPTGKKAIIADLEAAHEAYAARKAKAAERTAAVAAPPAVTPSPVAAPAGSKTGIDLAAWGRGQKDYLFGEVQKAVRTQYHAQLSERRAVVEFLIEQKVITAAEARRDV